MTKEEWIIFLPLYRKFLDKLKNLSENKYKGDLHPSIPEENNYWKPDLGKIEFGVQYGNNWDGFWYDIKKEESEIFIDE